LTAAFGAKIDIIDSCYDVAELSKYLDLIHLKSFNYHDSGEDVLGSISPLYGISDSDPMSIVSERYYVDSIGMKH
jgi:GH18 family chitinase